MPRPRRFARPERGRRCRRRHSASLDPCLRRSRPGSRPAWCPARRSMSMSLRHAPVVAVPLVADALVSTDTKRSPIGTVHRMSGCNDARVSTSLLERAQSGDDAAFAELTGPRVGELRLHCYRMLGSLVDAEDAVQETLLAAWRGLPGFTGQASLR